MQQRKGKPRARKRIVPRVRHCYFCFEKTAPDWKAPEILQKFTSERGKIVSGERTGLCPKHQRKTALSIKRCRSLGLLPFVVGMK